MAARIWLIELQSADHRCVNKCCRFGGGPFTVQDDAAGITLGHCAASQTKPHECRFAISGGDGTGQAVDQKSCRGRDDIVRQSIERDFSCEAGNLMCSIVHRYLKTSLAM